VFAPVLWASTIVATRARIAKSGTRRWQSADELSRLGKGCRKRASPLGESPMERVVLSHHAYPVRRIGLSVRVVIVVPKGGSGERDRRDEHERTSDHQAERTLEVTEERTWNEG
jgi:hypothetical protein